MENMTFKFVVIKNCNILKNYEMDCAWEEKKKERENICCHLWVTSVGHSG
jgi:hypothetical protein